ncbi:uncharacterized protein LOC116181663 [Photinus pyralis]|nr:uncharacterized protein LOC116181663 [Photinus pyralis]
MAVNISLWFVFILLANVYVLHAKREDVQIKQKSIHPSYFENLPTSNVQGAVVLKSNLPLLAQTQLAATLTQIYQTTTDPMQRIQAFQTATTKMYSMYWNVVLNFEGITFFYKYYIYLQIFSDHLIAFGLD